MCLADVRSCWTMMVSFRGRPRAQLLFGCKSLTLADRVAWVCREYGDSGGGNAQRERRDGNFVHVTIPMATSANGTIRAAHDPDHHQTNSTSPLLVATSWDMGTIAPVKVTAAMSACDGIQQQTRGRTPR